MTPFTRAVWRLVLRLALLLALLLLLFLFGPTIWHLFSPFILALPVAIALQRPIRWGESRLRLRHRASVAVWVLLVCAVLVALLAWLLGTVISQIIELSGNYQTVVSDIIGMLRSVSSQLLDSLDYMPESAEA